ncbi:class I SAM-dependent methyltransferase [Ottowia sp.]|uniref:class I SAM-dependent methyltransferase n=1 Tax=Ottowia sp. TaxID=1898956 RepID=UPI00345EB661
MPCNPLLDTIAAMPRPTEAGRVFHGRGGLYAGCEQWVLDAYPPVLVLTSFAPVSDEALATIGAALAQRWAQIALPGDGPLCWVFQQRGGAQRLEGRSDTRLMAGVVPQPHVVTEGGARYLVNVLKGQNQGLFLDMAAGRQRVAELVAQQAAAPALAVSPGVSLGHGARVLNLFAYTCAFSVVALRAGAARVVNVDMSRGALATGQQNHRLNGVGNGPNGVAAFWAHDIFSSWGKIGRAGPYDLVIADPPSYQKGSFVASKDYARLLRRLPDLLAPGGHALLCLNAPELPPEFLLEQAARHAPGLRWVERVPNPPAFADVDEARSLKVMVWAAG